MKLNAILRMLGALHFDVQLPKQPSLPKPSCLYEIKTFRILSLIQVDMEPHAVPHILGALHFGVQLPKQPSLLKHSCLNVIKKALQIRSQLKVVHERR
jgi:hypothetical protein